MSRVATNHILDPETLAEMNAEFRAGAYDKLDYPPIPALDPAGDPFERNYEWLDEPAESSPLGKSYASMKVKELKDWYAVAGRDLRKAALGGSLAGGTDDQIIGSWAKIRFASLCQSAGEAGKNVLAAMSAAPAADENTILATAQMLQTIPEFSSFDPEQLVATALIAFHWQKANRPS
jgi:hypothetical protein